MPALPPNNNTGLNLDLFIAYAIQHLGTVGGMIYTTSLYPPLGTPGPAMIPWSAYLVAPASPTIMSPFESITPDFQTMSDFELIQFGEQNTQNMMDGFGEVEFDSKTLDMINNFESSEYLKYEGITMETTGGVTGFGAGDTTSNDTADKNLNNNKQPITPANPFKKASGSSASGEKLTAGLKSGGWLGHEVEKVTTRVDPKDLGPKLKVLYGANLAKVMLACCKQEQGFVGFNNNIGGYDITAGRWKYNPKIHAGYVHVPEGQTKLNKAFVAFLSLETFFGTTCDNFIKKGMDKVTTADEFADVYYAKWFGGDSATALAFATYPNIAKANNGPHATLQDYRNWSKTSFKSCYKQIEKYV